MSMTVHAMQLVYSDLVSHCAAAKRCSLSFFSSGLPTGLLLMQSAAGARAAFEDAPNVTVVEIPINDGWARDWGPSVSPPPPPPQTHTYSSLA